MAQGQGQRESNEPTDDKENLTKHLLCFKHKMKNIVWNKGASGLDGYFHSGSEVDLFFLIFIIIIITCHDILFYNFLFSA